MPRLPRKPALSLPHPRLVSNGERGTAWPPVVLAWAHDTGADLAKTNVNGGAGAIGHPLGASGTRIMTTLVNALEQRDGRYGLQTMCEGGGMANATIVERLG